MSGLRLAAVLVAAAAALSTGAAATPNTDRPVLTFAVSGIIPLGICATDLNGHTFRLSDPRDDTSESWSPDGRFLAFIRKTNDTYADNHYQDFLIADEQGRIVRTLSGRSRTSLGGVWWSPDGTKFAGSSSWGPSTWLWVVNADGTGGHTIYEGGTSRPSWSPDGTRLLFQGHSGATYVVDADGGNLQRLVDSAAEPVWSPDGREFAYLTVGGLAVAAADGSDQRVLTAGNILEPAWSPDGTTIAFLRLGRDGSSNEIDLINRDGTHERRIAEGGVPVWSPDGDAIAFVTQEDREPSRVVVVKIDGTGEQTVDTGLPDTATFSPAWRRSAPLPAHRRPCVVQGTAGSDVLRGTKRGDVLFGGAGRDTIHGAGGRDVLIGGPGPDRLFGGPGNDYLSATDGTRDHLFGGPGWDRGDYDRRDKVVSVERRG